MDLFQKITAKKIIAYQQKLTDDLKLSPSTIKRRLSSTRKFCEWATKQGYLQENPFISTPPIRDRRHENLSIPTPQSKSIISKVYKAYHNLPATKYLHYGILIVFCAALGFGVYDQFFKKTPTPFAYSDTLNRPNRYLSFQGRLTDSSNNPISSTTNIDFRLWKLVSGGTEGACIGDTGEDCLWKSNTCVVTPDQDGIFSIMLGTTTGPGYTCASALEINENVFTKNQNVWLGITVDTDGEMDPRIQVATVGYALNAETLQGMPPGTGINSIPYINNAGDIIIAAASPSIQGISGTFAIEGQTGVTIQAGTGVGGSITISPKGDAGIINITSEAITGNLFNNQSGASFGTVGGKEANNLYYGYTGTNSTNLNLLKLESGATPSTKFTIDASGNASAAGILKAMTTGSYLAGDITVSGGDITGANGVSLDIGEADANYLTSSVGLAVGNAQTYYINSSGTGNLNALTLAGDLTAKANVYTEGNLIARSATISGTIALAPQVQEYAGTCNQSSAGKMYYDGPANKYYFCNGTSWTEMGANAVSYWTLNGSDLYSTDTSYNIGIGTTNPQMKLDVIGDATISGTLSLAPQVQEYAGVCEQASAGKMYYDGPANKYYFCNGTEWTEMGSGSGTSWWTENLGLLSPINSTLDLTIGGNSTASANVKLGAATNVDSFIIGNLGIGTTGPGTGGTLQSGARVLDIVGAAGQNAFLRVLGGAGGTKGGLIIGNNDGSGTNYGQFTFDNSANTFTINQLYASGYLGLGANSRTSDLVILSTNGNVGIGTTNPTSLFSVGSSSQFQVDSSGDIIKLKNLTYSWPAAHTTNGFLKDDGSGNLAWTTIAGAGGVTGSGTAGYLPKWNTSSDLNNSVLYESGGNVGIGTTNPDALLNVISNSTTMGGIHVSAMNVTDAPWISFGVNGLGSGYDNFGSITNSNGFRFRSMMDVSMIAGAGYKFKVLNPSLTELLVVDSTSGNVGIGTTSPTSLFNVGSSSQFQVNSSGYALLPDGSASTPALAFTGDTDNGLYRIGTNKIGLITGGNATQGLTIDASGNVGIGTTVPANKLSVSGAGSIGTTYATIVAPANGLIVQGNTGIGTTNPTSTFNVGASNQLGINSSGSLSTSGTLTAATTNTLNGININTGSITAGTWNGSTIGTQYGGTGKDWSAVVQGSIPYFSAAGTMTTLAPNTAGYVLQTNGASANPSWVDFSSTGGPWTLVGNNLYPDSMVYNVGIGTSNPIGKLDVAGTAWLRGSTSNTGLYVNSSGNVGIGTTNPQAGLSLASNMALGSSYIGYTAPTNGIIIEGNVGIGITTPTAKLQVVGTTILGNGLTGSEDALLVNTGAAFSGNLLKLSVNGTQKLAISSTGQLITASGTFLSTVADSGSAIAYNFDTLIAMTAPGAKLLSVKNAGDEKMSLDKDGVLALYNSESMIYNSSGDITIDAASNNISFATNSLINIDDLTLGGIASMSGTPNLTLIPTANLAKIYLLNGGDLGLYSSVGGDTGVNQILKISNNGEATISGTLSLAPQVQAFAGTCSASLAGKMYYDAAANKYYYCNGTSWVSVGTNYWTLAGNNLYPNLTDYNIGIGTTDPGSYKLYVVGDMAASRFVDTANSNYFVDPAAAGTSAIFYGKVGIGTTTPGSKLDVSGDINFTGALREDGVEILSGMISAFAGACPSGWTEYTAARGRTIVGTPSGGANGGTVGTALTNLENRPVGQHSHAIIDPGHTNSIAYAEAAAGGMCCAGHLGSAGNPLTAYTGSNTTGISIVSEGSVAGTNAPYVQLTYCQKNAGADLAEWIPTSEDISSSTIVSIDPDNREKVIISKKEYDSTVVGIIATQPGWLIGEENSASVKMALSGRVPTRVSLMNGEIKPGDPITTSPIPGVGMKATKAGPIVGKAMEALNETSSLNNCSNPETGIEEKCGTILVFVNISWFSPENNQYQEDTLLAQASNNYYELLKFGEDLNEGDLVSSEFSQAPNEQNPSQMETISSISKTSKELSGSFVGAISNEINGNGDLLKRERVNNQIVSETRLIYGTNTKVKISPNSEAILVGDPLVVSDNPGMAVKATQVGPTIGKALENWTPESGKETIQVLVNSDWYDPDIYLTSTGQLNITYDAQLGEEYQLKDEGSNLIKKIGAFAEIAVANLKAGLIKTQELIAEKKVSSPLIETNVINTQRISLAEISSSSNDGNIIINLENQNSTESAFGRLIIKGKEGQEVASIDSSGNLTASGSGTFGESLSARSVYTEDLQAQSASFSGQITSHQSLTTGDATVSGTLYAEDIMTKNGSFSDLLNASPAATYITQNITNIYQTTTASANETNNTVEEPSITATPSADLPNPDYQSPITAEEASSSATMTDEEINNLVNEILASASPEVASQAALTENINISPNTNSDSLITNSLTINSSLIIADDSLNSIAGPLYLQNLGLGGIDLLAGRIVIDQQGNAVFEGNVTVKGSLFAKTIQPLPENDLVIDLANSSTPGVETESKFGNLLIKGINNEVVASIDASGSAHFASLGIEADYSATKSGTIIAAYDNWQKNGEYSPALETNATAGIGALPTYEKEIIIYDNKITDQSLIYITPITDTNNKVIFVKAKKAYKTASIDENGQYLPEEKGWFKVSIDTPINKEIQFNWWIVN